MWIGRRACSQPRYVVIDATGLKVYGEGEWTVRQPGASRRRTWRKRHLAVDADSHEVAAAAWTAAFVGDAEVLPDLRAQRPAEASIATVTAAADDTQACHPALLERRAAALIPPRAGRWRGRHGPKVHRIHARPLWMPFNHTDAPAGNRSVAITSAA